MAAYYLDNISAFLEKEVSEIKDILSKSDSASGFTQLSHKQIESWDNTIRCTKDALSASDYIDFLKGVVFEYRIPRREKRVDCVILGPNDIILIEYKSGTTTFNNEALNQGIDYGLDIVNYHEVSRDKRIHVIICPTEYPDFIEVKHTHDSLCSIQVCGKNGLSQAIDKCIKSTSGSLTLNDWITSRYKPVPGILDAVNILFAENNLGDIETCLSSSATLDQVVNYISEQITISKNKGSKKLLLVSGVPGSGKTLVGLKLAHMTNANDEHHFVYMSGNGPLLKVLKASLARSYAAAESCTIKEGKRYSETMLHSVHSFIEEGRRTQQPPIENVVIFDEAQRAWNKSKMEKMNTRQRKFNATNNIDNLVGDVESEPKTLLDIMSLSKNGSVVVALCGNGQEIHDGEAGINEWIRAAQQSPQWEIISSPAIDGSALNITDSDIEVNDNLHLDIPMRTHRAIAHSKWVDAVLDGDSDTASQFINNSKLPIYMTRSLDKAREYLEMQPLGSRRYGLLASSGAARLRPYGIEVSSDFRKGIDYSLWFTGPKDDFRSSYALEAAATEFECQGLEIDWAIIAWSWDYIVNESTKTYRSISGTKWKNITDPNKISFLVNKYRVLLTRVREGMIIFVPKGSHNDPTRNLDEMNNFAKYLETCGVIEL